MYASLAAMFASANNRARATVVIVLEDASDRTTGFIDAGPVMDQKRAVSVCAAVRAALCRPPVLWISSKSRAHCSLFSAGGGPGRKRAPFSMTHVFTAGHSLETGSTVGT